MLQEDVGHRRVTHYGGAVLLRGDGIRHGEARIIGARIVIDRSAGEIDAFQARFPVQGFSGVRIACLRERPPRQEVIRKQPRAQPDSADAGAAIDRPGESERLDEMRRDSKQCLSLPDRLVNEVQLPVLEISNPAVNEPRGTARRPAREVIALDQGDLEPAHGRVPRHAATGNPAADDQQVELFPGELSHSRLMSGLQRNQSKV